MGGMRGQTWGQRYNESIMKHATHFPKTTNLKEESVFLVK